LCKFEILKYKTLLKNLFLLFSFLFIRRYCESYNRTSMTAEMPA